ncbi:MAG: hypothetical protein R2788_14545 [Saprospiraceae bacterium]
MKNANWKILTVGILIIGIVSCQPDRPIEKIEFPIEEFIVKSNSDTTLFGKQGTRIFIGSETFQFPNGDLVKDSIKVHLKEFYKKSDIILAELSTESNGRILETEGMVNIKAFANGNEIEIRPDKRIVVHFPKERYTYKKMNLFYADETSTDTSATNWNIDTINLIKRTLKLGSFGWWYPSYNDSTEYDFTPKNFVDTGYYWNPLDFYVKSYDFSDKAIREIERTKNVNTYPKFDYWNNYGVECEMYISKDGYIKSPKIVTNLSGPTKRELLDFLQNLPQLEPGRNKHREIIERKGLIFIEPGNIVPLYETDEEYVKSFDEKYSRFENTPIRNMDEAEINFYIFSVGKLGWINCDRFIEFEEKVDLLVNMEESPDMKLKLVFSEIDGILKPQLKDGKYLFKQVPTGQKATIVGIKNTRNELLAAIEEITIGESPIQDLKFFEITLGELRNKLDEI